MIQRILIHNSKINNNNFHLICSLRSALLQITEVQVQVSSPSSLKLFVDNFEPELIIFFGGENLSVDVVSTIIEARAKLALWTTEDPFEIRRNNEIAKYFDVIFTSDKGSQKLYSHPNCYHLPLAAEANWFFHKVIENPDELLWDLTFVGTAWPNRTKFIKDLVACLKQNNLTSRFILPTNPHIPSNNLVEINPVKFERDFRVAPKDLAKIYNYSLFSLTLFRDFSGDGNHKYQTSPTNRFYEMSLSGTGQIIVSNDFNIQEFYPEIEQQIFHCKNPQEIVKTIILSKENIEIRNQSAFTTQEFVIKKHSFLNRVQKLLSIVEGTNFN